MTKQQEIDLLDAMIAKFGPHSYLGPWLAGSRESIVADIRSDFQPDAPMPAVARAEGFAIVAAAKKEAAAIIAAAEKRAKEALNTSYEQTTSVRLLAKQALERLADGLR